MRKCVWTILAVVVVPLLMLHPAACADDTDGDGLPDDVEVRLGTDPAVAEELEAIAEDDVADVEDGIAGRYDIFRISMANVARGRWLWAIELAEPVQADNCIVSMYVDADADANTGRPSMGCEVAYSFYEGIAKHTVYVDEDEADQYPIARVAVAEGVLYLCGDIPLKQFNEHSRLRIRLHAQTIVPPQVHDRFGFIEVEGPPDSDREPLPLSPNGVVRGVVVDEDGNPVPGARIIGHEMKWKHPYDPFEPAVDITADAEGRFEGEGRPGTYVWIATADMMTSAGRSWDLNNRTMSQGSIRELTLTVAPGGAVRGTVIDKQTGEAIPGARLLLGCGLTAIADEQGRFSISGAGEGEQRLMAIADGMAHRMVSFEVAPGETHEVEMDMSPGFTVAGTVTDPAGNPVAGAVVRDYYSGSIMHCCLRRAYTDEQGRYELRGYSRERDLWSMGVEHPDYAKQSRSSIAPPAEGDTLTLDFMLDMGFAVAGTVTKPDGTPGVGATVQYGTSTCNIHYSTTKTDRDGEFLLDKLPTDRAEDIVVFCPGCAPASQNTTPAKGSGAPELTFELQEGHRAEGVVVDNDGDPIAGVRVSPMTCLSAGGGCCGGGDYFGSRVTSGADGRFTLKDLPAEGVTADVGASGYSYARQHPIEVDGHTTIVLDPPGAIKGKVVDQETGAPVTAFNVRLTFSTASREPNEPSPGGISSSLHRDGQDAQGADGTFTVSDLTCRAGYAVIISAEGYAPTRVERVVAATADDDKWPVVIELGQGETLTGAVTGPDGNALADAEVRLMWSERGYLHLDLGPMDDMEQWGVQSRSTQTDAQGAFELAGLMAGQTYALLVRHADYAAAVLREFDIAEPVAVKLALPGAIVGSVAGFGDFDLGNSHITISSDNVQWDKADIAADGGFEARNLAPGEYSATLRAPQGTHDWPNPVRSVTVQVEAERATELDFAALGGVTVSGRVLLRGEPLADTNVHIYWDDNGRASYADSTNSEGEFTLYGVPAGDHHLSCHMFGGGSDRSYSGGEYIAVADADVHQDIEIPDAAITGTVTDVASGGPIADIKVQTVAVDVEGMHRGRRLRAYARDEAPLFAVGAWGGQGVPTGLLAINGLGGGTAWYYGRSGASDDGGEFRIQGLRAGRYLLTAQGELDPIPGTVGAAEVAKDGEVASDLTVDRRGTLRLSVLDAASGEAIEGARVFLCTPDGTHLTTRCRRPLTDAEKLEQATCTTGSCAAPRPYTDDAIETDANGLVEIEDAPVCDYGAWVIADGYVARWAAEVVSSADAETTVVRLERGGTLTIKAADGLLEDLANPFAVWRIIGADGDPVFPGGENHSAGVWNTGAAFLAGDNADGYAVALVPGAYAVQWELHRGPDAEADEDLICSGQAQVEVVAGQVAALVLSAD